MNKYELALVVSAKIEDDARTAIVEKAKEYIDIHFRKEEKKSQHYHLNILKEYQEKRYGIKVPNEVDNRIYHILTRTPREFKNFLNIKYQIDISNSHPLLLNALIYEKYGIRQNLLKSTKKQTNKSISIIYDITKIIISYKEEEKKIKRAIIVSTM